MAEGLLRREAEGGWRTRERQRYHLTESGRIALEAWLAAPVKPEGTRNELALKLYFGQSAPLASSRTHLETHREHYRRLLARYADDRPELEARVAAGEPGAGHHLSGDLVQIDPTAQLYHTEDAQAAHAKAQATTLRNAKVALVA